MHCQVCDCLLTDEESTKKNENTGEYWDLCNACLGNLYMDIADVSDTLEYDEPIILFDQETE